MPGKNCLPSSKKKGRGVKKENLSWVCDNEEIQFVWSMISPVTIQEKSVRQSLLQEITYMWVTTRGYSKIATIKEDLKKHKSEGLRAKKALRKDLAKSSGEINIIN